MLCCGAVTRARFGTQDAYDCYRSRGVYEGGKRDSASFETLPLAHTDNHMWHHLVMTTKGHGKGMNMFIDGKLEATMPRGLDCENEVAGCVGLLKYSTIDGVRRPYSDPAYFFNAAGAGGDPIDPVWATSACAAGRLAGRSPTVCLTLATRTLPSSIPVATSEARWRTLPCGTRRCLSTKSTRCSRSTVSCTT